MRKHKKNSGFSLVEILMVLFLIGILGYLLFVLIFPIFRMFGKKSASTGLAQNLSFLLERMALDIQSSSTSGFNFANQGSDWTVALVGRQWPLLDSSTAWNKSVGVYHYDSTLHLLTHRVEPSPLWPTGAAILDGSEPPKLDIKTLPNSAPVDKTIPFVFCDSWTDPAKSLHLKIVCDSETAETTLNFARFLVTQ